MKSLEERITALEDIHAIKQMKAHYALCADAKYTEDHRRKPQDEIDAIAWDQCSVFSEDVVWDNGLFGCFRGKQAVWEFLRATPWKFSVHMFVNPLITLDGEQATGSWVIWEVATLNETDTAVFLSATLEDEYVKLDGRWYTRSVRMTNRFMTPYDEPWTKRRNAPYTP
jgi:hypothetical protein